MKNMVKKIILSYMFLHASVVIANEENFYSKNLLTEVEESSPTFWREMKFSHTEYCNHNNLLKSGYIANYKKSSVYTTYWLPSSVENRYIKPNSMDYSSMYQPWIWCFSDPESSYISFDFVDSGDVSYQDDEGFVFMEASATYSNEIRGPKIEAKIDYTYAAGDKSDFLAALYYLKEDGSIEKIKQISFPKNGSSIFITGLLPYPTLAYLKVWPENSGASSFKIYNIRFFTEDCKPDLINPGQCI
ncbi:hypothetical protein [Agarilytica rhodophyticola]|uniref:hypothetical protein n=1 Tax=Agarilytica rhodophyticola TaxID=1737490 RepID=UPI000B345882|nr:hypothetical protein [Agarilytica rhodophyticola]